MSISSETPGSAVGVSTATGLEFLHNGSSISRSHEFKRVRILGRERLEPESLEATGFRLTRSGTEENNEFPELPPETISDGLFYASPKTFGAARGRTN
ncbi:hypothetical protein M7I_6614 [Glarea lozoyensis 74030]|uniref:Uncharacterized protein n=1 Tax=Glarea lozoyensis (strain ATCC 74030 / MF5533) TaxID=1104152 RepID=H0EV22_GLAL7|nr:hypothetical protein M7I_6614 [Glarea lozoyensis 74030]